VPSEVSLIGPSKAAQKLAQQVDAAAQDLAPIFLQAAPGTGKTFVGRVYPWAIAAKAAAVCRN
jgi:transcriptional regulator with AAA-type ATPase domain